jgi:hypothetical protein
MVVIISRAVALCQKRQIDFFSSVALSLFGGAFVFTIATSRKAALFLPLPHRNAERSYHQKSEQTLSTRPRKSRKP